MQQPTSERPTPGPEPAEGRPDMNLPGADQPQPISERTPGDAPDPGPMPRPQPEPPDSPGEDLPERLGERIENGPGTGIAAGEPDLVPDVQVPEETM
jgi:hypothetical protein